MPTNRRSSHLAATMPLLTTVILLLTLAGQWAKLCRGLAIPANKPGVQSDPNLNCPNFRTGYQCGCPGFAKPGSGDAPRYNMTVQSDSPTEIVTDDDGTEFVLIGDMMFRREPLTQRSGQADQLISDPNDPKYKLDLKFWPGGIIFYMIDPAFSFEYAEKIQQAMKTIEENVGKKHLEFRKAQTPNGKICRKGYMFIKKAKESQCRAEVGMRTTYTRVWLNQDSCPSGTIQHEILHALGRYHEQCRPDRDKYVTLIPDNMAASECGNYYIAFDGEDPSLRITYDSASIMHYGSCHFSCNGKYTMLRKDGAKIEANRQSMTKLDVDKMRVLYPTDAKIPYHDGMCSDKADAKSNGSKCAPLLGTGQLILLVLASSYYLFRNH